MSCPSPQFVPPTPIYFNSLPPTITLMEDQLKISSTDQEQSEIVNIFLNKKYEPSEILTLSKIFLIIVLEVVVSGASDWFLLPFSSSIVQCILAFLVLLNFTWMIPHHFKFSSHGEWEVQTDKSTVVIGMEWDRHRRRCKFIPVLYLCNAMHCNAKSDPLLFYPDAIQHHMQNRSIFVVIQFKFNEHSFSQWLWLLGLWFLFLRWLVVRVWFLNEGFMFFQVRSFFYGFAMVLYGLTDQCE